MHSRLANASVCMINCDQYLVYQVFKEYYQERLDFTIKDGSHLHISVYAHITHAHI